MSITFHLFYISSYIYIYIYICICSTRAKLLATCASGIATFPSLPTSRARSRVGFSKDGATPRDATNPETSLLPGFLRRLGEGDGQKNFFPQNDDEALDGSVYKMRMVTQCNYYCYYYVVICDR